MTAHLQVLFLVLAIFLGALGCGKDAKVAVQSSAKPEPIPVLTEQAESRKLEKSISVTGSLNADESVVISPEISGRVTAIHADFGQSVRKGEVLAELDKAEYQIAVERTRAALNQALARIGLKPGQESTPPDSTAATRQSQAQLEDAKFKFESASKLLKTGDISQERYTELEKAYHARQAALEATQDDLLTMWSNMQSLRADLKLAEKRLNDTVLRAPFDGAILQKHVSIGQYVKDNTAILTLVKTSPMRLRVELPESDAGSVQVGTSLVFTTDAAPGAEYHAIVRQLNPSLDSKSRTLTVEARIQESDKRLRPGMFVQVRLITDRASDVVMVPRRAIYSVAGLTKLFVIQGGKASEKKIGPGREQNGWIEVPSQDVHAGDLVAVSNLATLTNGSDVRIERRSK